MNMDTLLLTSRIALGAFFALSGYHKLSNAARHATMLETMRSNHIPMPRRMAWFVSGVELLGGLGVLTGTLTPLAALGLATICMVACLTDGARRIAGFQPIDKADAFDDLLYLPETLYLLMLAPLILGGAGRYSIDSLAMQWWAQ